MKVLKSILTHWRTLLGLLLLAVIPVLIIHSYREKNASFRAQDLVWHEWYPGIIELNRPKRQIIWLRYTADWGPTALVNELRLLQDQEVIAALHRLNVKLIKVDCTNRDPITQADLRRYDSPFLPNNFLIPRNPSAPYLQLPELLTPEIFLTALKEVRGM